MVNEYQLSGWVIIVNGDGGCRLWKPVQADSQPKSFGLVWGSAASWRRSTFIKWTEWTLTMALSWWQHRRRCLWIIIIIIVMWSSLSTEYVELRVSLFRHMLLRKEGLCHKDDLHEWVMQKFCWFELNFV